MPKLSPYEIDISILNKIFNILIVYYWLITCYIISDSVTTGSLMHLLLVMPIGLFIIFSFLFIKNYEVPKEIIWILFFMIISGIYALVRKDITSFISIALLGSMITVIYYYKLQINLKLLNMLFLIAIVLSIPLYYLGYSDYGFYPGQAYTHHLEALNGRVALFSSYSVSVYFSLLIFIYNLFFNHTKSRNIFLVLSLYYIFFGISRTALIILLLVIAIYMFKPKKIKNSFLYSYFIPFTIFVLPIVLLLNIEVIINFLISLQNSFITEYFFRGYSDFEDIMKDTVRINIWQEHIKFFLNHPLGMNTSVIDEYMKNNLIMGTGSESFITRILVRYGFGAIFIYLFLFALLIKAIKYNNIYLYTFVYIFVFIGLFYGSFFTPYNFLFLIFIASINNSTKRKNIANLKYH